MQLSPLERVLRIFTDVRPGEGRMALLMFANVFLILCAYYFIKPLREGWISVSDVSGLSRMEVKAYSSFGQSLLLLWVVQAYGRLSERVPRGRLITGATLFCMSNMVVFWFLQPDFFFANLPLSGIIFYLWVGMFGVFIVAQFWAFAADIYGEQQGKRLIPLVAIGATAGGALGSQIAQLVIERSFFGLEPLGTKWLLLVALVPLAVSLVLTRQVDRRATSAADAPPPPPPPHADAGPKRPRGSLAVVLGSTYLLPVALITLLMNWVNTNGENLLFGVVQDSLASEATLAGVAGENAEAFRKEATTAFYTDFFKWVNVVALLLQALVASRLLKYGGFGAILMLMPAIALMSYSTMALLPVLAIVRLMKIAENATDYSINNTARHVLWLPVSQETKYKGKPTIDSLFARVGDGMAALTVLVGVQMLSLSTAGYFAFTVALVLVWIVLATLVVREHGRLTATGGEV